MKVHGLRSLLNPRGICSTAAIVAEIEDTSSWKPGCDGEGRPITKENSWSSQPAVTFQIANCDRSVAFEFEWDTSEQRAAGIWKVNRMIRALEGFRAGLEVEQKRYVDRQRAVKKKAE